MIGWKTIENYLSQWYHVKWWRKFGAETLKKVFSNEKKWLQERSYGTSFMRIFFLSVLLISCHTVFLVEFGINWSFSKSRSGLFNFSFLKNSLVYINSKFNTKPYDYLYYRSGSCNFSCLKNTPMQINFKLNSKPYDYLYKLYSTQFNYHYYSTATGLIVVQLLSVNPL